MISSVLVARARDRSARGQSLRRRPARRLSAVGRSLPVLLGGRTSRGTARCARRGACRAFRSARSPTRARTPRRPRWPPARRACRRWSMACAWHMHQCMACACRAPAMARIAQRRRPRNPNMAVLAADVGALRMTPLELGERERLEVHAVGRPRYTHGACIRYAVRAWRAQVPASVHAARRVPPPRVPRRATAPRRRAAPSAAARLPVRRCSRAWRRTCHTRTRHASVAA